MGISMRWSLKGLYDGFDSKEYQQDLRQLDDEITALKEWAAVSLRAETAAANPVPVLEDYLCRKNALQEMASKLAQYARLMLSADTGNAAAKGYAEAVEKKNVELVGVETRFACWLDSLDDFEATVAASPFIEEHCFYLSEIRSLNRHRLSEAEEKMIAGMKVTGSSAWNKLRDSLVAELTVTVAVNGETRELPLTVVRNLASDGDAAVRRAAYEGEMAAYPGIEEAAAACLNGIKGEVIFLFRTRGYASALEQTLGESRMDARILGAMMGAVGENLPHFQSYFRAKARLLGHQGGLPFYDLLAPVGGLNARYTYQEARDYIVKHFHSFGSRLGQLAERAFDKAWIDAEPRRGKVGGAFCNNIHAIKESRILSSFDGSFGNVITLAHELGHAYHGQCLAAQTGLNSRYTMPIAETASNFCETIVKQAALQEAGDTETLFILEKDLCGAAQTVVDIYSRFLFETELFRRREGRSLSVAELKAIMTDAQQQAYGDGLDKNCLHPYAWVAKPHYYYADRNYYNFPYTFGLLLAKGLYAEYRRQGEAFVPRYERLLAATGRGSLAEVAKTVGIDLYDIDFWRKSLAIIAADIEKFVALAGRPG